jgi:hypothetical protein
VNITATELKKSLRVFTPVRTESYQIGEHGISAQDSDVWIVSESPLSGLGKCFSVNGKKLAQVINRMSGQVEITKEEKLLSLKSARAKIELETQEIKPLKIPVPPEKVLELKTDDLKKALAVAEASASPNKASAFGGVVLIQSLPLGIEDESPKGYRVVGTDANVLTVVSVEEPVPFEFKMTLNLPAASVVQIMDKETVVLGESNTHLYAKSGGIRVFASKPTKTYPDFDGLLAIQSKLKFGFVPGEWMAALRTIETLIDESVDQGGIDLQFAEGVVQWSNVGVGSTASDESPYEQIDPDPLFQPVMVSDLRIKAKYLSGFLAKAGEKATIGLTDKKKPIVLESGNMMTLMTPMASKKESK